jgi:four helix bundle protein
MIPGELTERMLDLSVRIGSIVDGLPDAPLARHIAERLLASGTAAGPAYEHACAAERPGEFARGLADSLRQLRESRYWLRLVAKAKLLGNYELAEVLEECAELGAILAQSIAAARLRSRRQAQLGPWRARDTQFTFYALPFAILSVGAAYQSPIAPPGARGEERKE